MKMRKIAPIRIAKTGYIIMSVVFCLLGVTFMIWPTASAEALEIALGIVLMAFGTIRIVGYFSKDLFRLAFQFDLELGLILFIMGLIVLVKPKESADLLAMAMGIAVLADSLFKIRIADDSRKFGIGSWPLTLGLAIVNGCIGLCLMIRPFEAASMLTVLLGAALLTEGIMNLCVCISMVKIVKNQYPDVIKEEYTVSYREL
ncbi:MAG: DUF308 domain-containing protein [Lachnospiraceae bacterium]|nr:DUF308 domain-containing protein [Lachnospiraceae bacterium]